MLKNESVSLGRTDIHPSAKHREGSIPRFINGGAALPEKCDKLFGFLHAMD